MVSSWEEEASPEAPSAKDLLAGWCERPAVNGQLQLCHRALSPTFRGRASGRHMRCSVALRFAHTRRRVARQPQNTWWRTDSCQRAWSRSSPNGRPSGTWAARNALALLLAEPRDAFSGMFATQTWRQVGTTSPNRGVEASSLGRPSQWRFDRHLHPFEYG